MKCVGDGQRGRLISALQLTTCPQPSSACCASMSESSGLLSPPPRKQSLASSSDGPFSPGSRRPSHASINGHGGITSRKLSVVSSFVPLDRTDEGEVDPEDLFVRHTIAEVRAVQRKLK
jgi:hypothetical protein